MRADGCGEGGEVGIYSLGKDGFPFLFHSRPGEAWASRVDSFQIEERM